MKTASDLRNLLNSIHRKSYPAYKSLQGEYAFRDFILSIDHVQGDPFASPSSLSLRISHEKAGFPKEYRKNEITRTALADYLIRQFEKQISHFSFQAKGSGKSGLLSISHCGQEVLSRTAMGITDKGLVVRFHAGFPANGRTINAPELEKILFRYLPECGKSLLLLQSVLQRSGACRLSCRRPGIYAGRIKETRSCCLCGRRLHSPKRKRNFPEAYEKQYSFYFSGISSHLHGPAS